MDDNEKVALKIVEQIESLLNDPFMRIAANEATRESREQITKLINDIVAVRETFGQAARNIEPTELGLYCFAALMAKYAGQENADAAIGGALATAIIMLMEKEELIRTLTRTTK